MIKWDEIDWEDITPRLALFAIGRLKQYSLLRENSIQSQAEDLVYTAIQKTLEGKRVWQPERCTLMQHLCGVIASEISHMSHKAANRGLDLADDEILRNFTDTRPSPEESLLIKTDRDIFLKYLKSLDESLYDLASAVLLSGISSNIELSNHLAISVREVNNLKKKLRRALIRYSSRNDIQSAG